MMGEDELHASGKNGHKYEYERERGTFRILIVIVAVHYISAYVLFAQIDTTAAIAQRLEIE